MVRRISTLLAALSVAFLLYTVAVVHLFYQLVTWHSLPGASPGPILVVNGYLTGVSPLFR